MEWASGIFLVLCLLSIIVVSGFCRRPKTKDYCCLFLRSFQCWGVSLTSWHFSCSIIRRYLVEIAYGTWLLWATDNKPVISNRIFVTIARTSRGSNRRLRDRLHLPIVHFSMWYINDTSGWVVMVPMVVNAVQHLGSSDCLDRSVLPWQTCVIIVQVLLRLVY